MNETTGPVIRYLSLGWGVQSFCIAAMCALGEIETPDLAIHADTGHEAEATYDFANRWTPWLEERGLKVVTVQEPNTKLLRTNSAGSKSSHSIYAPAHTRRTADGKKGQIKRECTYNWKVRPMNRHIRSLLPGGRTHPGAVECWQGISLDEWHRMRTNERKYITNVYPLVDRRMTREHCVAWLESQGLEIPPKSACVFCPYHSAAHWRQMKQEDGTDWKLAVAADKEIRHARSHEGFESFVHRATLPLEEAVVIPEDLGAKQFELEMPCDGGVCWV